MAEVFEQEQSITRQTWNQVFTSSQRSRRSGFQFQCKCKNGYSGALCLTPPTDDCGTCGENEFCDKESAQCVCNLGWSRSAEGGNCDQIDLTRIAPCHWSPESWLRSDSNFLDCKMEDRIHPKTILKTVIPPASTRMLRLSLKVGQTVRKHDLFSLLNRLKGTIEKIYLNNVRFEDNEVLKLENFERLKSGMVENN